MLEEVTRAVFSLCRRGPLSVRRAILDGSSRKGTRGLAFALTEEAPVAGQGRVLEGLPRGGERRWGSEDAQLGGTLPWEPGTWDGTRIAALPGPGRPTGLPSPAFSSVQKGC